MPETVAPPIAFRVRPKNLGQFVGQEHIVGPGTALRGAIEHDTLTSVILSGPPGTGKTTLAYIIAAVTKASFVQLNAVTSGVKELKEVCLEAQRLRETFKQRTVLFIDEIHRFNKSQQDALLPYVESGAVILIGATTENPYFEVNAALVSRSHVYLLQPLSQEQLVDILQHALASPEGFKGEVQVAEEALKHMASASGGDARIALNLLELSVLTAGQRVSVKDAQALIAQRNLRYDKKGEDHYNTISAFIKSMRGSDPDAALLWMYKMLLSGEQPRFIFRRMLIFASEDVGNADPSALSFTVSAWQAFEMVGLPEGEYFLSHACVYLAQCPKSAGIKTAMGDVKKWMQSGVSLEVPNHLRNAPVKGMKKQGYGMGYDNPHKHKHSLTEQNYFPIGTEPQAFYQPSEEGFEMEVRERMKRGKEIADSTV